MAQSLKSSAASPADSVFSTEHEIFRQTARRFVQEELEPHYLQWEKRENGFPVDVWRKAGAAGLLGLSIPEEYGGPGCDILYSIVLCEEVARSIAGVSLGATLFNADLIGELLVAFGTDEQKRKYCPGILTGDVVMCAGISEPGAGSDVKAMSSRARRDGDHYLISGQKTYISNGMHANLCFFVAKTDEDVASGRDNLSMFLIDMDTPGFERRRLDTLGEKAGSVAELFLTDVRVPRSAMLGKEGHALKEILAHLFTADRVMLALRALAVSNLALDLTIEYTKNRKVFGKRVFDFQNTQFKLAEMKASLIIAEGFKQTLLRKFVAGDLDPLTSSAAKLWLTENEFKIAHECLQLHGGYGYMTESPISRIFTFARLETIYAGTSEIQKGTIARFL